MAAKLISEFGSLARKAGDDPDAATTGGVPGGPGGLGGQGVAGGAGSSTGSGTGSGSGSGAGDGEADGGGAVTGAGTATATATATAATPAPSLSDRELEVLKRVATGMENDAIAAELGILPTAVRNHVANILVKLQLRSRIEAALIAAEGRAGRAGRPDLLDL